MCIRDRGSSLKVGKERIIATIIGGIVGMAMLAFERYAVPIEPVLVRYLVISIMVIILMYITVSVSYTHLDVYKRQH